LLTEGSTKVLFAEELTAQRKQQAKDRLAAKLKKDDPLNPRPAAPSRSRGRGGRGGGRRGAGRGRQARGASAVGVGVLADQLLEHNGDSGGDATGEHIGDASSDLAAGVRADGGEQRGVLGDIYADNGDYAGGLDDFADDFDLEAELALLMDEDVEELEATFSMGLLGNSTKSSQDAAGEASSPAAIVMEVASAVAESIEQVGLAEGDLRIDEAEQVDKAASSWEPLAASAASDALVLLPPTSVWDRYQVTPPTPLGYSYHEGRMAFRATRGMPAGALTVRCYRHGRCTFLIPLRCDPGDEAIAEWCFSLPASPIGASGDQKAADALRHRAMSEQFRRPEVAAVAREFEC
jgi:hypothetical protein